jgi:hypothetical protein
MTFWDAIDRIGPARLMLLSLLLAGLAVTLELLAILL